MEGTKDNGSMEEILKDIEKLKLNQAYICHHLNLNQTHALFQGDVIEL